MVVPGLKDVVQGSTYAMSSRPRVSACSSFFCFPDEPRKIRGLSIRLLQPSRPGPPASANYPCGHRLVVPAIAYAEGLIHCNGCKECRLLFFGPVLKELRKQFRAVVMAELLMNPAAMALDRDAEALTIFGARSRPGCSVLATRPVVAFYRLPVASLWLFLPHLGDRLQGMGYIALHNGSVRAWRGGESALNCMDGNSLPR